jgi:L-ascorbate metabolism protein UlaG (beta-lactamase superfamily)
MEVPGMQILNKFWIFFVIFLVTFNLPASVQGEKTTNDSIYLTWMSNTNWLVEVEETRILLDGWVTRIPRPKGIDFNQPETLHLPPAKPDVSAVKRILEALDIKKIDYIVSGHSHFDHSFDSAVWARLTGAKIIGPKSTCLQAMAQGIPKSKCTVVEGSETIDLGNGLKVRVVQWNHSGDPSTPFGLFLQTPMELIDVPKLDSATGGLMPGPLDHFPCGGVRAYLFTLDGAEGKITWFYSNSGNASTFEEPAAIDQAFLKRYNLTLNNLEITPQEKSVKECLISAIKEEKLDGVHLWIGYGSSRQVDQVIKILKPKAFIPQHWGGIWTSFFEGVSRIYKNPRLQAMLIKEGIGFYPQKQYMDKYKLDMKGVHRVPNKKVQKKLGFKIRLTTN